MELALNRIFKSRGYLWLECIALFGLLPYLVYIGAIELREVALLFCVFCAVLAALFFDKNFDRKELYDFSIDPSLLKALLQRFAVVAVILGSAAFLAMPERFFGFALSKPLIFTAFLLLYPLLSVYPQEVIYRLFFYRRYGALFSAPASSLFLNALAFGWMHVVFNNPVAPLLSFIGGIFFAQSYKKGGLALAVVEHTLYGWLIFSIGIGYYFYNPASWR